MSTHEIVFLHFNDVYHISKRDDIARFITQLELCREHHLSKNPYTVFSGDVFSPSLEASILRGAHMLPLLKELRIDVACYGNHGRGRIDFDFGEARLCELSAGTEFPWLLSNAVREDVDFSRRLLASAQKYHTAVLQGFKIGFFGLAGTDWPSNCRELPQCTIVAPVQAARECAAYLRRAEGCDFVVALTHMRLVEDVEVSEALRITAPADERVDLLLGGHDHELLRRYAGESSKASVDPKNVDCGFLDSAGSASPGVVPEARGDVRIVKSGTDWNNFSCVRLNVCRSPDGVAKLLGVTVEQVSDLRRFALDPDIVKENQRRIELCLRDVEARIDELGAEPLVYSLVPLEGTGVIIRSTESNLCNMLADMVRAYYDVDIAFVNSGSVRCDKLVPAANDSGSKSNHALTIRDLVEILPFNNEQVVKRVSNTVLLGALENSFSDAHTDGRFLQMSGLSVVADWTRPEGDRILEAWFHPPNSRPEARERVQRAKDERRFTVAMVGFIADGFDGYRCFHDQETIVGEEGGVTDTQLLLRTLGYGSDPSVAGSADDSEADNVRIARARQAIVVEQSNDGLMVIAPRVEGRIMTAH